jgi:protein-L-isoaspartate(D-aspartate) O-methyltransferase
MQRGDYWTTEDADPRHVYHDVLIALDEARGINNGQPSLWALVYDQLGLARGAEIVHVGAGVGYYSAILAELVGREGRITAIELDPGLAAKARDNLAPWPQAMLVEADGFAFRPERPADAIIVNAGVTHLSMGWLDALAAPGGRLLVPFTNATRWGTFITIERNGDARRYAVRDPTPVGIIPCIGGRDAEAEQRLETALAKSSIAAVRSLRRAPEEPDETCWLAGDGWWFSTAPLDGGEADSSHH